MKKINFLLAAALGLALMAMAPISEFHTEFRKVFLQSIKGLDTYKGDGSEPSWKSTFLMPGFDETTVVKDETMGLQGLQFSMMTEDLGSAEMMMARFEPQVADALSLNDYSKAKSYSAKYEGSMKTVYEKKFIVDVGQTKVPLDRIGNCEYG